MDKFLPRIALATLTVPWVPSLAQEIGFNRLDPSGHVHAYILKLPNSTPTPIGPSGEQSEFAAWLPAGALIIGSPDGRQWLLHFCQLPPGSVCHRLSDVNTSQTFFSLSAKQLYFVNNSGQLVSCQWAPGASTCGHTTVFASGVDTFAINLDGSILAYNQNMPKWGPPSCTGILTLFIQGFTNPVSLNASRAFVADCVATYYPFWHPDEPVIAFLAQSSSVFSSGNHTYADYELGVAAADTTNPLVYRMLDVRVRQRVHSSDNPAWSPSENALYVVETLTSASTAAARLVRIGLSPKGKSWRSAIIENPQLAAAIVRTWVTDPSKVESPKYPNVSDRYLVYVAAQYGEAARRIYLQDLKRPGTSAKSIYRVDNGDDIAAPQIRP